MITLSHEQQNLFREIERTREHRFITGRAGTGKSLLLQHLRDHSRKRLIVVAPTGIAALNVGGQTRHSLFQLPPALIKPESLSPNTRIAPLLRQINMVVIDEVSMVRADLLDAIDLRLRQARSSALPFGGAQIVMVGDPYQLPPV